MRRRATDASAQQRYLVGSILTLLVRNAGRSGAVSVPRALPPNECTLANDYYKKFYFSPS